MHFVQELADGRPALIGPFDDALAAGMFLLRRHKLEPDQLENLVRGGIAVSADNIGLQLYSAGAIFPDALTVPVRSGDLRRGSYGPGYPDAVHFALARAFPGHTGWADHRGVYLDYGGWRAFYEGGTNYHLLLDKVEFGRAEPTTLLFARDEVRRTSAPVIRYSLLDYQETGEPDLIGNWWLMAGRTPVKSFHSAAAAARWAAETYGLTPGNENRLAQGSLVITDDRSEYILEKAVK